MRRLWAERFHGSEIMRQSPHSCLFTFVHLIFKLERMLTAVSGGSGEPTAA